MSNAAAVRRSYDVLAMSREETVLERPSLDQIHAFLPGRYIIDHPFRYSGLPGPQHRTKIRGPDAFYRLVEIYSGRTLTFESDKLPALSGLCERLHRYIGGDYLAGIWTHGLASGLLWTAKARKQSCKHARTVQAPSWSWAAYNGSVMFLHMRNLGSEDLILVEHNIQPRDSENPFGEVEPGYIVVEGLTIPVVRSRQYAGQHLNPELSPLDFDPTESSEGNPTVPVFIKAGGDHGSYIVALPRTFDEMPKFEMDKALWSNDRYSALLVYKGVTGDPPRGLMLRPKGHPARKMFERVGSFTLGESVEEDIFMDWTRETITLI